MSRNTENQILNSILTTIPFITTFFDDDIEIMLTDREKILYYQGSKEIDAKLRVGNPIGQFVKETMEKGRNEIKIIPEDFIGVSFKSYMICLKEGGKVVGSLSIGKSLSKKKAVTDITDSLIKGLSDVIQNINCISSSVTDLAKLNTQILNEANAANELTNGTDHIVNFIKGVSAQTNLLGLNASIEAARAGEYGRGFTIVAQEIRKLSTSSNDSIGEIESVIKNISNSIDIINEKITTADKVSEQQVNSLKTMQDAIKNLNSTALILNKLADEL